MKNYAISKEALNELPADVITNVKNTLRTYNKVNVIFENGKYNVSAGISIKSYYATDHKFIGTAYAEDIYTLDERTQNYIEEFKDFPSWYNGPRDYSIFHK